MGLARLHFPFRNDPDRLVKINLRPFYLTEFAGTLEDMRRELERIHDGGGALIILNGAEQRAKGDRISDRREMIDPRSGERADQELSRIALRPRRRDSVAKHPTGKRPQEVRSFQSASTLMLP